MPRPTKAQLLTREQNDAKLARYKEQEAKRATRIQIDQNPVLWTWVAGIGIGFIAAAVISFNGITNEARNIGLDAEWMRYLMFFVVEFLYLMFLVADMTMTSRGDRRLVPKLIANVGMWFFAGVAIYANAIHSLNFNNWDLTSVDTWTGVVLGVSAPVAIIAIGKLAPSIVFSEPIVLD